MSDIIYRIKWDQWIILAACANLENMFGFFWEEPKMTQRKMALQLYQMVKRDMLEVKKGKIVPKGEYAKIMSCIQNTKCMLLLEKRGRVDTKQGILYLGKAICVWVSKDKQAKRMLQVCLINYNDWMEMLREEMYFPVFQSSCKEEWEKVECFPKKEQCSFYLAVKYAEKEKWEMAVLEQKGRLLLIEKTGEQIKQTTYKQGLLLEKLQKIEEEEIVCM